MSVVVTKSSTFDIDVENWTEDLCKNVAESVLVNAQDFCPIDTGNLRDSLELVKIESGYMIYTDVKYWSNVEFGTRYQKAQPFLRPALARAQLEF